MMSQYKTSNKATINTVIVFFAFPIVGVLSFILPVLIINGWNMNDNGINVISIVNYYYKNVIFIPTAVLLFVFGVINGYIVKRYCLLLGLSSIFVFPCVALYEML